MLTPGPFNSAYYEHSFLADKLGVELVEGRDLIVDNDTVYMRTTEGPKRVDVIYRRIDDDFLDPEFFKPESILGVPGIMRAYQAGNITIANAVGTGIADDKAIYTFMPEIIEFYLGEPMKLKNVQTWRCREPDSLKYVLDNLGDLVVKEVNGSGGYGMLVGPHATKEQIETFAGKLKDDPANFIAQPTLALSTCPTYFDSGVAPRHVDLRPFVLSGSDGVRVVPGGLTRVALERGLAGRQLEPGRRHQGHLDRRRCRWLGARPRQRPADRAPRSMGARRGPTSKARAKTKLRDRRVTCWHARPTRSIGSRATWSAPTSSPVSSRRRSGSPGCRRPMPTSAPRAAAGRAPSGTRRSRRRAPPRASTRPAASSTRRTSSNISPSRPTTRHRSAIASPRRAPTRARSASR